MVVPEHLMAYKIYFYWCLLIQQMMFSFHTFIIIKQGTSMIIHESFIKTHRHSFSLLAYLVHVCSGIPPLFLEFFFFIIIISFCTLGVCFLTQIGCLNDFKCSHSDSGSAMMKIWCLLSCKFTIWLYFVLTITSVKQIRGWHVQWETVLNEFCPFKP